MPTDRFFFLGFLPEKTKAREEAIAEVASVRATLVFYESGKRLGKMLAALAHGLGNREAAVAREITKRFEECVCGTLDELAARYAAETPKGEIVVMVGPPIEALAPAADSLDAALGEALTRLPPAKAAGEVAKAFGADRKALYARAMALRDAQG